MEKLIKPTLNRYRLGCSNKYFNLVQNIKCALFVLDSRFILLSNSPRLPIFYYIYNTIHSNFVLPTNISSLHHTKSFPSYPLLYTPPFYSPIPSHAFLYTSPTILYPSPCPFYILYPFLYIAPYTLPHTPQMPFPHHFIPFPHHFIPFPMPPLYPFLYMAPYTLSHTPQMPFPTILHTILHPPPCPFYTLSYI